MVLQTWIVKRFDHMQRPTPPAEQSGPAMAHDHWLLILANALGPVAFASDSLALYRQHGANLSGAPSSGLVDSVRRSRAANEETYHAMARFAEECGNAIARLARAFESAGCRTAWAEAVEYYRLVTNACVGRAQLYAPATPRLKRLSLILELIRGGQYRLASPSGNLAAAVTKDLQRLVK